MQIFDYCRFASVLNKETEGPAALQKAVVQSFLHNYDDAILVLDRAAGLDPSPSQYILLGLLYLAHSTIHAMIRSAIKYIFTTAIHSVRFAILST